jgi:hypothetical protein
MTGSQQKTVTDGCLIGAITESVAWMKLLLDAISRRVTLAPPKFGSSSSFLTAAD